MNKNNSQVHVTDVFAPQRVFGPQTFYFFNLSLWSVGARTCELKCCLLPAPRTLVANFYWDIIQVHASTSTIVHKATLNQCKQLRHKIIDSLVNRIEYFKYNNSLNPSRGTDIEPEFTFRTIKVCMLRKCGEQFNTYCQGHRAYVPDAVFNI